MSLSEEAELLVAINRELPASVRVRHDALHDKLSAGTLDEAEHAELLRITDEIELLQAERVRSLVELARIRGKKLGELMNELGIEGPSDAAAEQVAPSPPGHLTS